MGLIDNFLDALKLNDDFDEDEEFIDDDFEEDEKTSKEKQVKHLIQSILKIVLQNNKDV